MNFIASMDPHTCISGDEMGLEKTIQTLEACQRVRECGAVRGCFDLVIAPKVVHNQWLQEIEHAFAGVSRHRRDFTQSTTNRSVAQQASRPGFRRCDKDCHGDFSWPVRLCHRSLSFRHIILDEGHLAKKVGCAIHEAIKHCTRSDSLFSLEHSCRIDGGTCVESSTCSRGRTRSTLLNDSAKLSRISNKMEDLQSLQCPSRIDLSSTSWVLPLQDPLP
jgi:hypothetical protein